VHGPLPYHYPIPPLTLPLPLAGTQQLVHGPLRELAKVDMGAPLHSMVAVTTTLPLTRTPLLTPNPSPSPDPNP